MADGKARFASMCRNRLALLLLCCLSLPWWTASEAVADARHLVRAQRLTQHVLGFSPPPYSLAPGEPAGDWRDVALPYAPRLDYSFGALPGQDDAATQVTWYKADLTPPAGAPSPRYLYIPRWKSDGQIAVYGDGRLLYQSHANLQWNGSNHPLLIALDSAGQTPREITIRIQHLAGIGGALSSLWVGDYADLGWRYTAREWLQTQLPFMCSAAFLAIGIFSFFVWLMRRRERLYLLFFFISLAAYIRSMHEYAGLQKLPISDEWFGWLTVNSLFWIVALTHLFLTQLHRRAQPWLTRLLLVSATAFTLLTLPLPGMPDATIAAPISYVVLLVTGNLAFAIGFRNTFQSRSKDGMLLAGWSLLCMQLGIHDWLLQNNLIDIEGSFLGSYANIGVFVLFTYVMFHRYLAAIDEVERVNANLEARLQAREAELTISHRKLREVEQREMLSQERQRLMQDMHDGLGSSLVSALRMVEHGQIDETVVADVLKGCIDDLKLAIDSLEPVDADLLLLLATLRFRLGPRLEAAGFKLRWEVTALPAIDWLDPRNALHILRILQEAITNIVKHAHATEIRVATRAEEDHVTVSIADNGQGFNLETALAGGGKGLANQRRRADAIGARIEWSTNGAGSEMRLRLPVRRRGG